MADDSVPPPNRPRGRPRVAEPGVTLTTYLRHQEVAKIRAKAKADGVSVAKCVYDLLFPRKPSP
jgi:hypothetical protein